MTVTVVVLAVLLVGLLAAGAALWVQARALRERVRELEEELELPVEEVEAPPTPPITVQIENPQELAARESWAARRFGALVPRVVGREVANRAAQQITDELTRQGVRAEVRVLGGPVLRAEPPAAGPPGGTNGTFVRS
jgi:hypothetical protein